MATETDREDNVPPTNQMLTDLKCSARFEAAKDGKGFLTDYYEGESAKRSK